MPVEDELARCRPPRPPLWHYPAILLFSSAPACLVLICLLVPLELINNFETPPDVKYVLCAISAVIGVGLMVLFLFWEQKRWYWSLTPEALYWGYRDRNRIPLSSLKRIVPGRPLGKSAVTLAFAKTVDEEIRTSMATDFMISLLLVFENGSLMPFHVHRCDGGTALMRELVESQKAKLDSSYTFSDEELKRLRFADWNRLTKPR